MTIASQAGSWLIASRLMPHVPPRVLMAPGAVVAARHGASDAAACGTAVTSRWYCRRKSCWASAFLRDGPGLQHRDPWGRPSRGRSCVGDRQHRAADRRIARHRGADTIAITATAALLGLCAALVHGFSWQPLGVAICSWLRSPQASSSTLSSGPRRAYIGGGGAVFYR